MKRIPNITFTDEEYQAFFQKVKFRGGEAIICSSDKPNTLYKIFYDEVAASCLMSDNKLKKIAEIYRRNIPYCVKPIRTISYEGRLIGYEVSYDSLDKSLESLDDLDRKDVIKILRATRDILKNYEVLDITYGDVTSDNILVNIKTGKVTFCDIDNIRLGVYPADVKGFSLTRYYEKTGVIDAKADAYMHNLLTIKSLQYGKDSYESEIMKDLKRGLYPTRFKQGAREIFASMVMPERFNGKYAIEYVKR